MKKILGIVVLCLLWCNVGIAQIYQSTCTHKRYNYVHKIITIDIKKNTVKEHRFFKQSDVDRNREKFPGQQLELEEYFKIIKFDKNKVEYIRTVREWLQFVYNWTKQEKWNPNNPKSVKKFFKRKDVKKANLSSLEDTMQWFSYEYSKNGQVVEVTSPFHGNYKTKTGIGLDLCKKAKDISFAEKPKKEEKTPEKKEPEKVVKKPKKKEPPKKQITKAPEIDESLLTIGSGSGFYINNKGYALTNNHVVDICKQMVAVVDGREILLRVLNTDKINDVAVLKTDYKSRSHIKINEDGAKLGENVIAVGYPLAGQLSDSVKITRGIVSSLSGLDNNIGQIQIDAALQPGNSGGPVLNEKGALIGIASAGLNKLLMAKEAKYIPENVNFAVSSPIIVNILKSKKIKYTTPSMFSGTYSNTELAELGDSSTIQLFCRNTRTAYNRLKRSNKYSTILLDLD